MQNITRRTALKSGAIAASGLGVVPRGVQARESSRFIGVEYDPQTKEIRGEISGQFNQRQDRLVGNLNLTDTRLQFNQGKSANGPTGEEHVSQFVNAFGGGHTEQATPVNTPKRPLRVQVISVDGGDLSGATDYGVEGYKRAFRMRPISAGPADEIEADIIERIQRGGSR